VERTVHEGAVCSTNTEQYMLAIMVLIGYTLHCLINKVTNVFSSLPAIIGNKHHYQQSSLSTINHYQQFYNVRQKYMERVDNIGLRATAQFLLIIIDTPVTRQLCVTSHYCCL